MKNHVISVLWNCGQNIYLYICQTMNPCAGIDNYEDTKDD